MLCRIPQRVTLASVVIPALNAESTLERQLNALEGQECDTLEIVVVDNRSDDDTARVALDFARSSRHVIRVVAEECRGVNAARNAGIAAASNGKILICDADDVVEAGWAGSLAEAVGRGVLVAGKVVPCDSSLLQPTQPVTNERCTFRFGKNQLEVPFGGNCAFWKDDWALVGGFDTSLSGLGDEAEFFARLLAIGCRVEKVPWASIKYVQRTRPFDMRQEFYRYRHQARAAELASAGGVPRPQFVRPAMWLLLHVPYLAKRRRRLAWTSAAGRLAGKWTGWVEHRPWLLRDPATR